MVDMCRKNIIPSINEYILKLTKICDNLRDLEINTSNNDKSIKDIVKKCDILNCEVENLVKLINDADEVCDITLKAYFVKDYILKSISNIRNIYDEIEEILPRDYEPFPTYNEILF